MSIRKNNTNLFIALVNEVLIEHRDLFDNLKNINTENEINLLLKILKDREPDLNI